MRKQTQPLDQKTLEPSKLTMPLGSLHPSRESLDSNQGSTCQKGSNHNAETNSKKLENQNLENLQSKKTKKNNKKSTSQMNQKNVKNTNEKINQHDKSLLSVLNKKSSGKFTKGTWKSDEDRQLIKLVSKFGPQNWTRIAEFISLRSGKQCRERWHNHLNPNINKQKWSLQEDKILIEAHKKYYK